METLYRKVAVSERKPKQGWVLTPDGDLLFKNNKFKCPYSGEVQDEGSITHWLEPIQSDQTQIEKLEAEKKELLEALENLTEYGMYGSTGEDAVEMKREIEFLIQKHKR